MRVVGSLQRVVFWDPSWAVVRTLVRLSVEDSLEGLARGVCGWCGGGHARTGGERWQSPKSAPKVTGVSDNRHSDVKSDCYSQKPVTLRKVTVVTDTRHF